MLRLSLVIALAALASAASAQTATSKLPTLGKGTGGVNPGASSTGTSSGTTATAAETTMSDLLSKGYDIKTAVPNGGKFIIFMQKDQSAYACEFQSLTGSRCGSIN
jgi:hypothetical protein